MPRVLLIDDESTARADLRSKLAAHPAVQVVGEAATLRSGRELLAHGDYDLVFLDIQLIGGNAFDLVGDVREDARIVFVTAHDAYALRAFEINALDYLLKPVIPERLASALQRVGEAPAEETAAEETGARPAFRLDDEIYLRGGRRARFAAVADISLIAAQDNYSEVLLADGSKILLRKSLASWEAILPVPHFMRVHRTLIVNLARVMHYERDADEHTRLYVQGAAEPVAASRGRWAELRERLSTIRPTP